MRRARTIIGLPVISLDEGIRVGRVRDLVFDPDQRAIAALVIGESAWRRDAELVPADKVRRIGRDAVTIPSLRSVIKARSSRDLHRLYSSGVTLDGLLVMTDGGNYLGIIDEVILDDHVGIVAYEISTGFAKDVNQGKCQIPANEALTIGRDVALFPEGVESLVLQPAAIAAAAEEPSPAEPVRFPPMAQKSA